MKQNPGQTGAPSRQARHHVLRLLNPSACPVRHCVPSAVKLGGYPMPWETAGRCCTGIHTAQERRCNGQSCMQQGVTGAAVGCGADGALLRVPVVDVHKRVLLLVLPLHLQGPSKGRHIARTLLESSIRPR